MGKRPSLKNQFVYLINKSFRERMNKRSLKIKYLKGKMNPIEEMAYKSKIFSYGYKNNLLNFVTYFINWLKEKGYYPHYKYVVDLNAEVFAEFMEDMERRGASYKTLNTFNSYIRKLENIVRFRLRNPDVDYTSKLKKPLRVKKEFKRRYCMDKGTYFKLINHILESKDYKPTGNNLGILLIAFFGLRAKELCKAQFRDIVTYEDIAKLGDTKKIVHKSPYNLYLRVMGKNGRRRYLPVVFRFQYCLLQYIKELQKQHNIDGSCYITSLSKKKLSDRSVRKLVRQKLSEIGVNIPIPSSSHMIRKTWTKMLYEFYKNGGGVKVDYTIDGDLRKVDFSEVENLDFDKIYNYKEERKLYLDYLKLVSLSLGHNRVDSYLFNTYLGAIPLSYYMGEYSKVTTIWEH